MIDPRDPLADSPIEPIARAGALTADEFTRRHARVREPVVLDTPCDAAWTLARLEGECAHREVSAIRTHGGRLKGTAKQGTEFQRVAFGEIVTALRNGGRPDWHVSTPVADFAGSLARDAAAPVYCANASFVRSRVWLAPAGTVTPLHWDLPANFIRPLFGRRRVLLYPPWQGLFLRPNPAGSRMPNFARFDPERTTTHRFARPVRAVIGPGDLLFIPPGWWHHIRSLETSLVVNYWWGGRVLAAAWRAAQWYKSARGLYRNEWTARQAGPMSPRRPDMTSENPSAR